MVTQESAYASVLEGQGKIRKDRTILPKLIQPVLDASSADKDLGRKSLQRCHFWRHQEAQIKNQWDWRFNEALCYSLQ